ncbi:unnamed protein product [Didymodactylos carnosus]|uniref:NHL repeat-containing protein n=1 Tax=Didymodactylos carnosus TaxID=1234261 RepID=A0A815P753_9BILA|nr:unnamed protein product [Didymodactylos carnosus]CAF1445047.1 unnamed protein product [Didymodactylos carnosus]CAF3552833.1 unnamed protein product [Didymodactylos carnosus]CAF4319994.1 unnamed protein product [Didymodactylos carnosus]
MQLQLPTDVYVDSDGNIFVADSGNKRLQMWAPNATQGKTIVTMGDSGPNTVSGNSKYQDEIYVFGSRLMKYSTNSSTSSGSYLGFLAEPANGMVVDQCDTVYVTAGYVSGGYVSGGGRLSKFTSNNVTEQILLSGLATPSDVILDQCGHLFVAEAGKHRIVRYSTRSGGPMEVVINKRGLDGSDSEHLNKPISLSFDSKWNLYVSDTENHRIQKFDFLNGYMWC